MPLAHSLLLFRVALCCIGFAALATDADAQPYVYGGNNSSNYVGKIDVATGSLVATIPTGMGPDFVVPSPDGTRIYVSYGYQSGESSIAVIDTGTDTLIATIDGFTVGTSPIAISPDGTRLFTGLYPYGPISVIDTTSLSVVTTIDVGYYVSNLVVSQDGTKLYAALYVGSSVPSYEGLIVVIDTATYEVLDDVAVGYGAYGIGLHPNGTRMYVASFGTDTLYVVDTTNYEIVAEVPVDHMPYIALVSHDGSKVYVENYGSTTISVVDTTTNTETKRIEIGSSPSYMNFTPDGSRLYLGTAGGDLVGISTACDTVVDRIALGFDPYGVGIIGSFGSSSMVKPLFDQSRAYKSGSTVPIKLEVLDCGGLNASSESTVLTALDLKRVGGNTGAAVCDAGSANPDNTFRYVGAPAGGYYIFNLSTKGLSPGTYHLTFRVGWANTATDFVRFEVK
jgi:YVTN family beta-propeller protein